MLISIDVDQAVTKLIKDKQSKADYAVSYAIDQTARDVISLNKNYLLTQNFDFQKQTFKTFVGRAMWQFPRGARGIRANNLQTNLFYGNDKIDDYFSLHEDGGVKTNRVVPFGYSKKARTAKKLRYAKLTGQSGRAKLTINKAVVARTGGRVFMTKTGIFERTKRQSVPLFTFQKVAEFDKKYKFSKNAKMHSAKKIQKNLDHHINLINHSRSHFK